MRLLRTTILTVNEISPIDRTCSHSKHDSFCQQLYVKSSIAAKHSSVLMNPLNKHQKQSLHLSTPRKRNSSHTRMKTPPPPKKIVAQTTQMSFVRFYTTNAPQSFILHKRHESILIKSTHHHKTFTSPRESNKDQRYKFFFLSSQQARNGNSLNHQGKKKKKEKKKNDLRIIIGDDRGALCPKAYIYIYICGRYPYPQRAILAQIPMRFLVFRINMKMMNELNPCLLSSSYFTYYLISQVTSSHQKTQKNYIQTLQKHNLIIQFHKQTHPLIHYSLMSMPVFMQTNKYIKQSSRTSKKVTKSSRHELRVSYVVCDVKGTQGLTARNAQRNRQGGW
ncbi:uncharacterized protein MYCFIDRAFT_178911 [Pseudocercospora fijiensis CIRAD86]|uniref:Uncharacterized protein n=1 Tax=Pseudocercospora fijiensis (strain CIRAD86) TaxID=383855 RepID=M2ZI77_PSEFD|nr:uncharacterized protein MYCFIDRAFT_178911 [Pseudocercospora fijiensis CIRAD86]EME78814.1 hypothetical protein MYCFIDRAFT_178911 [Pseudocercospora fijiensis CIRAD86]